MLFNSFSFLVFFPIVTVAYFLLPHRFRWMLLLAASCVFYAAFIPVYLLILVFTILVDYFAGMAIENAVGARRRSLLLVSLVANVGTLAVFKYSTFLIENVGVLGRAMGLDLHLPVLHIVLPIGLSFHTFQAMSYTIEVYRGHQRAERHLGLYALYVMFYPQLVAGPIERPQNLLHQFREVHRFDPDRLLSGLRLMIWGMFKKVVIADRVALYVSCVYADPRGFHYLNLIVATLFFSIQIYCDFSGYSDIAIGAARVMGFDLMINFKRPYFAANIQDFWRRWHVSLSTWFKDYLYVSLGGSRRGVGRTYFNLAVVFLVSGLWHGANWTFVVWGALHAVFLLVYMVVRGRSASEEETAGPVARLLSTLLTFTAVTFAWIFFRAGSLHDAFDVVAGIVGRHHGGGFLAVVRDPVTHQEFGPTSMVISLVAVSVMLWMEWRQEPTLRALDRRPIRDLVFCSGVLSTLFLFGVFNHTGFIYFQF